MQLIHTSPEEFTAQQDAQVILQQDGKSFIFRPSYSHLRSLAYLICNSFFLQYKQYLIKAAALCMLQRIRMRVYFISNVLMHQSIPRRRR